MTVTTDPTPPPAVQPPSGGIGSRILRASVLIMLAHLALKLVSLLQFRLLGAYCDTVTRDVFVFAFNGVLMLLFYIGEEGLGPAFLPVFMQERKEHGEEKAWRFANTVLVLQAGLLLLTMAAVAAAPETIVRWITAWERKEADPALLELSPLYVRYMVLALLGLSLGSTTYMILNGYKRFFLAALGDAAVKIGIVAAVLVGVATGIEFAGWDAAVVLVAGAVAGSGLKLVTHLAGLWRERGRFSLRVDLRSPAFKRFLWLMLPLMAGIVVAKSRDLFNNIYVMTHLETGLLANAEWGRKIFQTIGHAVPYAVSLAMLPFFCEMVDRGESRRMGELLTRSGRLILLLTAPLAAGVVALSLPLAQLLYQTGKFNYTDAQQVATANACYSLVLPFYALEYVLMQAFFSNRKMVSVTLVGIGMSLFSMLIAAGCVIWPFQLTGTDALAGVALAFTISRVLKVIVLAGLCRRFVPCFPAAETLGYLARIAIVSIGTGLAAWIARSFYESHIFVAEAKKTSEILLWVGLDLTLASLAGGLVGLSLMLALCRSELREVVHWARQKLRRRKGSPAPSA